MADDTAYARMENVIREERPSCVLVQAVPEIVGAKKDRPKDAETALMHSFALCQLAVDQGADFVLEAPCMVPRKIFQQGKRGSTWL